MELLVKPVIQRLLGMANLPRPKIPAVMTRKVLSPMGQDEFLRVKLGRVGDRYVATPLTRGAGVMMSMVRADGIVRVARFSEGVAAGEVVDVELLRHLQEIESTIVVIGSHDLTLDLLASELRRINPHVSLSSSNVGSLGGLLALQRGEAHLAGLPMGLEGRANIVLRDGVPITTVEHLGMAGVSIPNFVRHRVQAEIDQQLALAHDLPVVIETFELQEGQVTVSGTIR